MTREVILNIIQKGNFLLYTTNIFSLHCNIAYHIRHTSILSFRCLYWFQSKWPMRQCITHLTSWSIKWISCKIFIKLRAKCQTSPCEGQWRDRALGCWLVSALSLPHQVVVVSPDGLSSCILVQFSPPIPQSVHGPVFKMWAFLNNRGMSIVHAALVHHILPTLVR